MKLFIIANNFEGNEDGIGKHARILNNEYINAGHDTTIFSVPTSGLPKWKKALSFGMTKALIRAANHLLRSQTDYAIIEYPFDEFNPCIVISAFWLYITSRCCRTKIVLSMHEFDRVNIIRKIVILYLLLLSDIVFVTEDKYIMRFRSLCQHIYKRDIPNHIVKPEKEKPVDKSRFCYFGLISPTKAFTEMIQSWNHFNKSKDSRLDVISSSRMEDWMAKDNNEIYFHHNLSDKECADIMYECAFSIIPVKPSIGVNNSSFMSTIQCGCLPIGKFNNVLKEKPFVWNVDNYQPETLASSFAEIQKLSQEQIMQLSDMAISFGERYSSKNTAKQILDVLLILKEK